MTPTEKPALSVKPSTPSADWSKSPFSVSTGRWARDWACARERGRRPAAGSAGPTEQRRPMGPLLGRRIAMADGKANRGPDDRSRINLDEDDEVRCRGNKLGISKPQLEDAMSKGGSQRALSSGSCARGRRAVDLVGVSLLAQAFVRFVLEFPVVRLGIRSGQSGPAQPNALVHAAQPSLASSRLSASGSPASATRCLTPLGSRFLHRRHRSGRRPFVRPRDPCRHPSSTADSFVKGRAFSTGGVKCI